MNIDGIHLNHRCLCPISVTDVLHSDLFYFIVDSFNILLLYLIKSAWSVRSLAFVREVSVNNSFSTRRDFWVAHQKYQIYDLNCLKNNYDIDCLPYVLKVLLENVLRHEDGKHVLKKHVESVATWGESVAHNLSEIAFTPTRVLLQDFTGLPAMVDLAAMRDAMIELGKNSKHLNPTVPVDLVVDHSLMVDYSASQDALLLNTKADFKRNQERYMFLQWVQSTFKNFRVVPPSTGIIHQINLEFFAEVITRKPFISSTCQLNEPIEEYVLCPDTLVGSDSHTTMINALGVLAWGVGGIEAQAVMLGHPLTMQMPRVVGIRLVGQLQGYITSTDVVLTMTAWLRKQGVVGKFIEFFGEGLASLSMADRATISNMAPEYGATCAYFPIDEETLTYLRLTGRNEQHVQRIAHYAKHQGLWHNEQHQAHYSAVLDFDLSRVQVSLAGPKRPQDRISLGQVKNSFLFLLQAEKLHAKNILASDVVARHTSDKLVDESGKHDVTAALQKIHAQTKHVKQFKDNMLQERNHPSQRAKHAVLDAEGCTPHLKHGDIVIAAITSCTSTSNPSALIAAGLVAQRAHELGLTVKPWVKTSFAPGSKVVPAYLELAGLMKHFNHLGFHVVGFGCTTCIGNSGPLKIDVQRAIRQRRLNTVAVLSGNRNFETRIHDDVRSNYLASPPLVVAYALAGSILIDLDKEPLGIDAVGLPVFLRDLWPSEAKIQQIILKHLDAELFRHHYKDIFTGSESWQALKNFESHNYAWSDSSYIKKPPYFRHISTKLPELPYIDRARCLLKLGDSVTTDHISPAGELSPRSVAGLYLLKQGVEPEDFNSLGSRRGNHEVMVRAMFSNRRLRNRLVPGTQGGITRCFIDDEKLSIYKAATRYQEHNVPLIILAGKEYGTGSSRDWAAKGTKLLGVQSVIAESFERIHRANLVCMGVLPLQFMEGQNADSLGLSGEEFFHIGALEGQPNTLRILASHPKSEPTIFDVKVRIDTDMEWQYYVHDGILPYLFRHLLQQKSE